IEHLPLLFCRQLLGKAWHLAFAFCNNVQHLSIIFLRQSGCVDGWDGSFEGLCELGIPCTVPPVAGLTLPVVDFLSCLVGDEDYAAREHIPDQGDYKGPGDPVLAPDHIASPCSSSCLSHPSMHIQYRYGVLLVRNSWSQ